MKSKTSRPLGALLQRLGLRPAALGFALFLAMGLHEARSASPPDQPVILTVSGKVGAQSARSIGFTLDELEQMGTTQLVTVTPFTNGLTSFTGVLLRRILEVTGFPGDTIHASALNDYAVDIPVSDAKAYEVILATRIYGDPIPVRARGPLWVIYPWSQHVELAGPEFGARSIWQVRSLELR